MEQLRLVNTLLKKANRLKNNIMCNSTQRLWFLSATELSNLQDKKIAEKCALLLPVGSMLGQALMFVKHQPDCMQLEMLLKKPKSLLGSL
ncbi:hypothetical protein GCM10023189_33150 [Nibrella saemangeumensis]|uniref:Uncharacterized protein n=1 Tax=Nibrella saemangeumensis TaxID=1084526 RepID=A0ABP8N0X2_9BACT